MRWKSLRFCWGLRPALIVICTKTTLSERWMPQVRAVVNQALGRMLRNHLEAVVRRKGERFDHGALHTVAKCNAIVRGSSLAKIDSYQWHGESSSFVSMPEKGGALGKVAANGGAKHLWCRTDLEDGRYKKRLL